MSSDPWTPGGYEVNRLDLQARDSSNDKISFVRSIPFLSVHLMCLAAIWTGVRWVDVAACVSLYYLRMTFLTIGYHRYFSHRTFSTNRVFQFFLALGGTLCVQKGPLWWAAHHRSGPFCTQRVPPSA